MKILNVPSPLPANAVYLKALRAGVPHREVLLWYEARRRIPTIQLEVIDDKDPFVLMVFDNCGAMAYYVDTMASTVGTQLKVLQHNFSRNQK